MRAARQCQNLGRFERRLFAVAALLTTVGCQQSSSTVSGTVTLDGKPLSIASNSRGTIVLQPTNGQGTTASGILDSNGHFTLASGASADIATGKYQAAVSVVQLLPKSEGTEQGAKLITPAKYASANTSGFVADVLSGANEFRFDMSSNVGAGDGESATDASASSNSGNIGRAQSPSDK
jgi:hypothetical protein